jgi:hypothetical protein
MQVAQPATQVDPEVGLIENAKATLSTIKKIKAVVVNGRGMYFSGTDDCAHSVAQFNGRILGIRKGEYFFRLRVTFIDQAGDAVDEDRSLARAGAGDHQHGSTDVLDSFALAIVGSKRSGTGVRLHGRHPGSGYH